MKPEIREFPGKLFAGICRRTSFVNDLTSELWREFRSREREFVGRVGGESYSIKVYDAGYSFSDLDPSAEFDKWAAAEVATKLDGLDTLTLPSGEYAVFVHKGPASGAPKTFGHIFSEWLPDSVYELDLRPHFEVLPESYNPFDTDAEEEIWIPIRIKVNL